MSSSSWRKCTPQGCTEAWAVSSATTVFQSPGVWCQNPARDDDGFHWIAVGAIMLAPEQFRSARHIEFNLSPSNLSLPIPGSSRHLLGSPVVEQCPLRCQYSCDCIFDQHARRVFLSSKVPSRRDVVSLQHADEVTLATTYNTDAG